MARPILKIKDLTEKSRFIKIEVRITALWVVNQPPRPGHVEMIVMDTQGDEIQVGVRGEEYIEWVDTLKERTTYIMENFRVVRNEEKFRACNHPYKMYFIAGTNVRLKDIDNMPPFQYKFANFEDVLAEKFRAGQLIDIIGVVQDIHTSADKMVALALKDLRQIFIQCTLWDAYAKQFIDFWKAKKETESVVVIIRRVRIKEKQAKYGIGLSNLAYNNVTQIITDQEIKEIIDFKEKFGKLPLVEAVSDLAMSQMSSFSQFDEKDKFMWKATPMCLEKIMDIRPTEDLSVVTVAEAVDFVYHKGGWYFDGCSSDKCGKKRPDQDSNEPYTCVCGRFNKVAIPRYKLEILVKANESTTKLNFFDEHCSHVLGITAKELKNQMLEIGEGDRKSYPIKLNDMLEKMYALRIRIQKKFTGLSVQRCSLDANYIQTILEKIQENEGTSKIDHNKTQTKMLNISEMSSQEKNAQPQEDTSNDESDDTTQFATQDLSAMAENYPDKNTITPSKRLRDESEDNATETLNASGQLSTNKLKTTKKFVKVEKNI